MFLVDVDAYARWADTFHFADHHNQQTYWLFKALFASYWLPKEVVTEIGPQFTSGAVEWFINFNAVQQIVTPAYHPASQMLAERLVKNLKKSKNRAVGGMSL